MTDFILDVSFDARDRALEEAIQSRLFLTPSSGNISADVNGTTTISAYFDSTAERDQGMMAFDGLDGIELKAIERQRVDWLERYQQSLEPIFVGQRFVIAPDAALIPPSDRLAIIVPQEQAFGTGSHETTSLCMAVLESLPVEGKRGLDVGAGSGILALAMNRLGASKVVAFDNDVDAYGALRDNRIRNGVPEPAMPLFIGGIEALRGGRFDVVTMNIVPEVIVPLLGEVVAHLDGGAALIVSGILVGRRDEVVRAAVWHRLRLVEEREKGEWWCGRFAVTGLPAMIPCTGEGP